MRNGLSGGKNQYAALIAAALLAAVGVYYYVSRSTPTPPALVRGAIGLNPSVSVLTGGYDNSRTSANLYETALTPAVVAPGSFGKLFSLAVDGQIFAQPLYLQNVAIDGKGTHNVVFAATMHNTLYAFDADSPATPLWSVNLGPSVPTSSYNSEDGPYTDITPENGILSTPVIDSSTGIIYAVAATVENGSFFYRLHALDSRNGSECVGSPVAITASVPGSGDASGSSGKPGTVSFDPAMHLQRPALLLTKGVVYVAFGSHGDGDPYHGWILGYSAQNIQNQVSVFNATPNGGQGAFWQSGRGPAADDNGILYGVASNGDFDGVANFGSSVLRLDASGTKVADFFSPYNAQDLNDTDSDLAAGPMLIPGTKFVVAAGKQGVIYLLDRTNLGHSGTGDTQIVQRLDLGNPLIFNLALWNRADGPVLYTHAANMPMTAYKLTGGQFTTSPVASSPAGFAIPYQGMTISANGGLAGSGILWVLGCVSSPRSPGVLHAYNADTLAEIWNSGITDGDAVGGYVKFANPTVANGKVYVPTTSNQLIVYGSSASGQSVRQIPVVTGIVNAASYANGPLAPGEIVAIMGQNLGPQNAAMGVPDAAGTLGAQLAGTQVTFNDIPGPLYSTSSNLVTAIVPYEVSQAANVTVVVRYHGQATAPQVMPWAVTSPGIFSYDSSGSGPGAILNADNTLNSPSNPAQPGSIVIVSAGGGGQTNPPSLTGSVVSVPAPLLAAVSATVGGQDTRIVAATSAPGAVAGPVQVALRLPPGVSGTIPVVLTVGGQASQATVTVSVQPPQVASAR